MCSWILCRTILSRSLANGESRDIGLYDFPSFLSLFGFKSAMILASFQLSGMQLVLIIVSKIAAK